MSQATIELTDGTQQVFRPDDSRDGIIKDFGKGAKTDDFAGTWRGVERAALYVDPPVTARVVMESGKRYLLESARLTALTDYLTAVGATPWNRKWQSREITLFAGFSAAVPKDGT